MTKSISILRRHPKNATMPIHGSIQFGCGSSGRLVLTLRCDNLDRRKFTRMLMGDIIATLEADGYILHNKCK